MGANFQAREKRAMAEIDRGRIQPLRLTSAKLRGLFPETALAFGAPRPPSLQRRFASSVTERYRDWRGAKSRVLRRSVDRAPPLSYPGVYVARWSISENSAGRPNFNFDKSCTPKQLGKPRLNLGHVGDQCVRVFVTNRLLYRCEATPHSSCGLRVIGLVISPLHLSH